MGHMKDRIIEENQPTDIVDALADREESGDVLAGRAVNHILKLRKNLMELACAVRGSETLDEAIEHANRIWPLNVDAVLIHGFHEIDRMWRDVGKTKETT